MFTLGFACYSFSSSFRCRIKLFIWDISCFLRLPWITLNCFCCSPRFLKSHVFIFMFQDSFIPPVEFPLGSIGWFVACWLVFTYLCCFSFLPVVDFWFHAIVIEKDAWHDSNLLEFIEACFLANYVIYPGKWSICTAKTYILILFSVFIF